MTKVTIDRTLIEQVIEAMTDHGPDWVESERAALSALRNALAEPAPEPVTDEENERFSQDVSNFKGTDEGATMYALERFLKRRTAALAEPAAWMPVADGLPKSGVVVLACYRNRLGNLRRIRANWVAAKTEEASNSDENECAEYDEATDTFYITQGWYECIDNWGDYSSVAVTEGEVTHWMPLPPAPEPVAYVDKDGFIVEIDEVLIAPGDKLYAAPVREPAPVREVPLLTHGEVWAIWNGEIGVDEMNQKDAFRFAGLIETTVRQKAGL